VLVLVVLLVLEARWHQLDRVCVSASFRLLSAAGLAEMCFVRHLLARRARF
jgi:hypothetical protein